MQGRKLDWLTGFQYYVGKWYDPEIGRWVSEDPNALLGSNLYRYATNSPQNVQFLPRVGSCAEVRVAAGHTSLVTTSVYLHIAVDDDATPGRLFAWEAR